MSSPMSAVWLFSLWRAGKRAVTADTAMRLGRLFGMTAQTWMNLQTQYDLEIAENELGDKIDQEVMPIAA
ncbi:MAG: HigA family addiction module antitoxin [Gallionellaceae bacterium]|jgi:plasmid maintenance system antidote protein VapI